MNGREFWSWGKIGFFMAVAVAVIFGAAIQYGGFESSGGPESAAPEQPHNAWYLSDGQEDRFDTIQTSGKALSDEDYRRAALELDREMRSSLKQKRQERDAMKPKATGEERADRWRQKVADVKSNMDRIGRKGEEDPRSMAAHLKKEMQSLMRDAPREVREND